MLGIMYQMRPCGVCPALFKANFPYLGGFRNVYHARPQPSYALPVYVLTLK